MFLYGRIKEIYEMAKKKNLGRVLSVGCGDGGSTAWVENLIGIDVDKNSIELAQKKYPHQKFICGRAEKLPFPSRNFDTVLAMDVLQLTDEKQSLGEIFRVLKPGGLVLISVSRNFLFYRILDWETWYKPEEKFEKVSFYEPYEIMKKIEKAGLKVKKIYSRGLFITPVHRFLAIPFEAFDYFVLGKRGTLGPFGLAIRRIFAPLVNLEFRLLIDFGCTIFIKARKPK